MNDSQRDHPAEPIEAEQAPTKLSSDQRTALLVLTRLAGEQLDELERKHREAVTTREALSILIDRALASGVNTLTCETSDNASPGGWLRDNSDALQRERARLGLARSDIEVPF